MNSSDFQSLIDAIEALRQLVEQHGVAVKVRFEVLFP